MSNPYDIVRQFEAALCAYTGAPYCVTTTSCTAALLLAVAWHLRGVNKWLVNAEHKIAEVLPKGFPDFRMSMSVEIPSRTYVGVAHSIVNAGGRPVFRRDKNNWRAAYLLNPLPVWDSARWFTSGIFPRLQEADGNSRGPDADTLRRQMVCVSFHHTKTLGLAAHGGAILHDNKAADSWLRRARFYGRTGGIEPKDDLFDMPGWHCYMTPSTAAEGLMRLATLPKHNDPLPWGLGTNSDYPDLSLAPIFK